MHTRLLAVILVWILAAPALAQELADDSSDELAPEVVEEASELEDDLPPAEPPVEKTESEIKQEEAIEADTDGSLDDASNSIDIEKLTHGFGFRADVRVGYFDFDIDERDGTSRSEEFFLARWRLRTELAIAPYMRGVARVAGICSEEDCGLNFVLEDSIPTNTSINDGDVTLDEAYLHWHRLDRFDLAVGRMQTRFVARGGVFAKSLDRNDSNNVNVNWTDGLHTTFRGKNGWDGHLILQHNSEDGPTNVRRGPLDFSDPGARITYFLGLENRERTRFFLQRGFDISYLPDSLAKDGLMSSRREDYVGIVIRSSNRWPDIDDGPRLRVASEIGYAPETQTRASAGIAGSGDVGGLAWNVAVSWMEFRPNHSIGINYGEVDAGWLLSPQFRQNERLTEIRYQWRRNKQLAFDFRIRKRQELERLILADQRRDEIDFFLRFTWGKTVR